VTRRAATIAVDILLQVIHHREPDPELVRALRQLAPQYADLAPDEMARTIIEEYVKQRGQREK
jgi:hypothetical protein